MPVQLNYSLSLEYKYKRWEEGKHYGNLNTNFKD